MQVYEYDLKCEAQFMFILAEMTGTGAYMGGTLGI